MQHEKSFWQRHSLLIGLALLVVVYFFFVLPWLANGQLGWWSRYYFDDSTGHVGDTIGGISAPFVGLLSAFLLYYSFREQVRANQLQRDALVEQRINAEDLASFETLLMLFNEINSNVDTMMYEGIYEDTELLYGVTALRAFAKDLDAAQEKGGWVGTLHYPAEMTRRLQWTLRSLRLLIEHVNSSRISELRKTILLERIRLFFQLKLHTHLRGRLRKIRTLDPNTDVNAEFARIMDLLGITASANFVSPFISNTNEEDES